MKKHLSLVVILMLSVHVQAKVGPSTGGGGFTVSCPENPIEPQRTVLLDLYEAEDSLKFQLAQASGSIEQDYFQSAKRTYELQGYPDLADSMKNDLLNNLKRFFRIVKFVQNSSELPKANDLGDTSWIPSQCQVQQLAYFDDLSETVFILQPLWDKMDSLSKAALAQHEIAFRHYRTLGDKDSSMARRLVGHMFSASGPLPVRDGVASNSRRYYMQDKELSTVLVTQGYSMGKSMIRVQFEHLAGYAILAKTWADFESPAWDLEARYSPAAPFESCVVKTPGVNQVVISPLKGTITSNLYLKYEYITGRPVVMTVLDNDGQVITTSQVTGNKCLGSALN